MKIINKIVEMYRIKKYIFSCFMYIKQLKLPKKNGKKWYRSNSL